MNKLLLSLALVSSTLFAAPVPIKACCKAGKVPCCKETCCKAMDHCCKDTAPKDCAKDCAAKPAPKG